MEDLYPHGEGIFQQNNDPKYTAASVRDYIRHKRINILPWLSRSPDLNPIENLWHIMDYKMKARKPQNETQLFESCQETWIWIIYNHYLRVCRAEMKQSFKQEL